MERSKKLWALVMMVLMLKDMWYCDCCLKNERNALLQLMSSFPFNPFSRGLDTADCCNWGKIVQCNPTTGKVNQLDLSSLRNSNSSGDWYLNASLFLPFQQLETLKLRRNNIAGCLHNEGFERLSTLSSLEWLDLSENRFNNSILQSLGGLSSLKYLSLHYNNFKKAINIQELDGLSKLEELDLSANEITEFVGSTDRRAPSNLSILHIDEITIEGRSMLFQTLGAFVHVKTLYLRWCNFKGILMGQGSNNVSQVKELYLVSSSIDENFLQILGATMSSLKLLSMPGVKLNGSLPSQGLCQLKHLEKLDISSNNLSGNLPMCLANLSSLRVLDLSYNYFTGSISLSPLRSLISLKYLYLSYNLFQIPFSLTLFFNHSKLQFLYASGNTICAETEDHNLTPSFQLKSLFLSGHGNGGVIPKFLYHQHNLQYVDLSHIKMKGEFPHWLLENNTKLENLYLTNNSLLGSLRLPNHPHMNLSRLSISKNGFSGYIPLEIGVYFPRLRWLQMSGNEFSNSIPSSFGNMSLLENLDLSNNSLSGAVPDALSNCTWLNMVDISDNLLSGKIPRWIRNMSSLETLVLSKNFFSGSLPSNFCSPLLLSEVYLSKNKLQGSFADAFFDCRSLIVRS